MSYITLQCLTWSCHGCSMSNTILQWLAWPFHGCNMSDMILQSLTWHCEGCPTSDKTLPVLSHVWHDLQCLTWPYHGCPMPDMTLQCLTWRCHGCPMSDTTLQHLQWPYTMAVQCLTWLYSVWHDPANAVPFSVIEYVKIYLVNSPQWRMWLGKIVVFGEFSTMECVWEDQLGFWWILSSRVLVNSL